MKLVLALSLVAMFVIAGCSGTSATSTPSAKTLEQKRAQVVTYLKAYTEIQNAFNGVADKITYPGGISSPANIQAFTSAFSALEAAGTSARERLTALATVPAEADTATHKEQSLAVLNSLIKVSADFQVAARANNQASLTQQALQFAGLIGQSSGLNRITEALLLKYNIADTEVDYQGRGR